jgi:hypothetical protein
MKQLAKRPWLPELVGAVIRAGFSNERAAIFEPSQRNSSATSITPPSSIES